MMTTTTPIIMDSSNFSDQEWRDYLLTTFETLIEQYQIRVINLAKRIVNILSSEKRLTKFFTRYPRQERFRNTFEKTMTARKEINVFLDSVIPGEQHQLERDPVLLEKVLEKYRRLQKFDRLNRCCIRKMKDKLKMIIEAESNILEF